MARKFLFMKRFTGIGCAFSKKVSFFYQVLCSLLITLIFSISIKFVNLTILASRNLIATVNFGRTSITEMTLWFHSNRIFIKLQQNRSITYSWFSEKLWIILTDIFETYRHKVWSTFLNIGFTSLMGCSLLFSC